MAVGSASVYVTGSCNGSANIAGTARAWAGGTDMFVAKYTDPSTGLTSADGGAVSGGGAGSDVGQGMAIAGQQVYVRGYATPSATFGSTTLASPAGITTTVLARPDDDALPLLMELVAFTATLAGPAVGHGHGSSAAIEVERSPDGEAFAKVGTLAAVANSATPHAYALLAATLPAGASRFYYRLRKVNLDGMAHYSVVRAVALTGVAASLSLYPNPARGGAATLLGATPGTVMTVLDALGRPVATAPVNARGTARLALPAGLTPGVYVVRAGS